MEGVFDPATFLAQQTSDAMDTTFAPVAAGEYTAIVEKLDVRSFAGQKDPSKTYVSLDVAWDVDSAAEKLRLGRDKLSVRQSLFLDVTPSGGLDTGKGRNIGLGRLREAVGLNTPGRPFSFNDLIGKVAKIAVVHRPAPVGDDVFAEVKAVAKLT